MRWRPSATRGQHQHTAEADSRRWGAGGNASHSPQPTRYQAPCWVPGMGEWGFEDGLGNRRPQVPALTRFTFSWGRQNEHLSTLIKEAVSKRNKQQYRGTYKIVRGQGTSRVACLRK